MTRARRPGAALPAHRGGGDRATEGADRLERQAEPAGLFVGGLPRPSGGPAGVSASAPAMTTLRFTLSEAQAGLCSSSGVQGDLRRHADLRHHGDGHHRRRAALRRWGPSAPRRGRRTGCFPTDREVSWTPRLMKSVSNVTTSAGGSTGGGRALAGAYSIAPRASPWRGARGRIVLGQDGPSGSWMSRCIRRPRRGGDLPLMEGGATPRATFLTWWTPCSGETVRP